MPSFLFNRDVAQRAARYVEKTFLQLYEDKIVKRDHFVQVYVDPTVPYRCLDNDAAEWNRFLFKAVSYIHRTGSRNEYEYPYDFIALGKAWLTHKYGLPSRQIQFAQAYLCQEGDTIYGGSVIDGPGGLIVACSGVDSEHDEMLAGCGMWLCKGMAQIIANKTRDELETRDGDDANFFGSVQRRPINQLELAMYTGRYEHDQYHRCRECDSRDVVLDPTKSYLICNTCGHTGSFTQFQIPRFP